MNYNTRPTVAQLGTEFIYKVYACMSAGLALTASAAYIFANSSLATLFFQSTPLMMMMLFAQLGLVFLLSTFLHRLSYFAASASFAIYSFITGISLSSIFLVYTYSSIASVFVACSVMFGALALYGYYTKADLSKLGSISIGALFGIIIASVINMFLRSSMLNFALSIASVIVFSVLTMYDMQKIKNLSAQFLAEGEESNKIAIICGLMLYLDFINLFLSLLRLFGQQRNNRD